MGSAWLAAFSMIIVLIMVLLSMAGRTLNFYLPGADAYAGYAMAASGFLALAHTLKRGEHIRVTLIVGKLNGAARKAMELWALTVGGALSALVATYSWRLVLQSHQFHDISTGNDATPLWIPQLFMALGATVLFIALLDEWVLEWQNRRSHQSEETRHE
jgi:TRAP-type C4-dicarboxylate transport system permease small subunit